MHAKRGLSKTGAGEFPHAALTPFEASPRMDIVTAARVCDLIEEARALGLGGFATAPALVVAVFKSALTKYLVNESEAAETVARLEAAIARAKSAQAPARIETARGGKPIDIRASGAGQARKPLIAPPLPLKEQA